MQKHEFESLIGKQVPEKDYKVIECVYQFHPVVSEVSGKEEVAELYKSFGMRIFYDMLPRAEANCDLEKQLRHAQARVDKIRDQMEELKHGIIPERVQVSPEVIEQHTAMQKRMRERDKAFLSTVEHRDNAS